MVVYNYINNSINHKNGILKKEVNSLSKIAFPNPIEISNMSKADARCNIEFNILPYRDVSESLIANRYILKNRYIKAFFSRKYKTDMLDSPDHLIFLTSLVHLQKMIYIYLCYEFGYPITLSGKEKLKIWPTKINIDMKNMITQNKNLSQSIEIKALKKTGKKSYFGKCFSLINNGEATITADAVIYIL